MEIKSNLDCEQNGKKNHEKKLIDPIQEVASFLRSLKMEKSETDSPLPASSHNSNINPSSHPKREVENDSKKLSKSDKPLPSFKNPISWLYELAQRKKIPRPKFDDQESEDGFQVICSFVGTQCVGKGSCRKVARMNAADNCVKQLTAFDFENTNTTEETFGFNNSRNYVGGLQEYSVKHALAPPRYCEGERSGGSHGTTFLITCTFLGYCESGMGRSKREAKRFAAFKVYHKVMAEIDGELNTKHHLQVMKGQNPSSK